ncbi:MAG: glycosyltransferase family 4 protein [Isosphaeraceae bacterium]|nr:glycosyltransferase family 4 protein [Isosphaeraceae bacterium]
MKIALVTRRYPPLIGGAEKVLSYLAEAFADAGAEVSVLTSRLDPTLPALERPRPRLEIVRLPTSPVRILGTWIHMTAIQRWLARHPVDLAYVSMMKHDAYATLGAGAKRGFPVVLRPEGAGATGDVAWQKWGRFGSRIAARCRTATAYTAISSAVRDELEADGYPSERIVDIPNGVPMPETAWVPPEQPRRAVYVGRLAREKGLDVLIESWRRVVERAPDARLRLVGDGPIRGELEALTEEVGLDESVEFAGAKPDASSDLAAGDLFVLPSREEGMSIALLEAMALGIPVAATSIPGNRRLIEPGEHGRLAAVDDPIDLADTILASWSDPAGSARMGRAARERVRAEFSIERVARVHLEFFERLIR